MRTTVDLDYATAITLGASGLVFLLALILGVWKYEQMRKSPDHLAHPYVDIAHRSSLLYAFATALVAVFVHLSAWPTWLNLAAAMVMVVFFVGAIGSYILHGMLRDTTNQFAREDPVLRVSMIALMVGEIGGFLVLFAGFVAGRF
ncbi:hypothetical protein [Gordonia sputi]